ncbi:MAG: cytochrome c [Rhizobacter sp.]|nr:cytochrome c [Rhizobacter sp.]
MRCSKRWYSLALASALLCGGAAQGQGMSDFGKREFDANCASCHGLDGKGKGVLADFLRKPPPDLTTLTVRNEGVFPLSRLYDSIEGGSIASHGTREMPVWGWEYRTQARGSFAESPYDTEAYVRVRILALLEYLSRLQQR